MSPSNFVPVGAMSGRLNLLFLVTVDLPFGFDCSRRSLEQQEGNTKMGIHDTSDSQLNEAKCLIFFTMTKRQTEEEEVEGHTQPFSVCNFDTPCIALI